jgi:hypothetical protein
MLQFTSKYNLTNSSQGEHGDGYKLWLRFVHTSELDMGIGPLIRQRCRCQLATTHTAVQQEMLTEGSVGTSLQVGGTTSDGRDNVDERRIPYTKREFDRHG